MQENRVQLRLLIVAGCMALWMVAVFGRLGVLQFIEHSFYLTRAHRQQQRTVEITPKRGAILDRNMHPLAMSTEVESAYAIPTELGDNKDQAARLLAGIVEIPRDVLASKFNSGNTFVWVSRKLPPEKSDAVKALNLKGIYTMKENERFYPNRDLAAHVLGFVNLDEKGISGLEFQLDKQVRGKGDRILVMADARQRWFDAEQGEVIPADQFAVGEAGHVSPLDSDLRGEHAEGSSKDAVLIAQVAIHRVREVRLIIATVGTCRTCVRSCELEHDQSIWFLDRQATEKQLVNQRKDAGVCSDPQGESNYGSSSKAGSAAELAHCVFQIL